MDAIKYLRSEHSKIRRQFALISKIKNEKRQKTRFKALCKYLVQHETMEQKTWYPVLRKNPKLKTIIKHLVSEEKSAAKTIKKFSDKSYHIIWTLRFLKFRHDVNHHAKDEETKLFPKVRKAYSKKELNQLGIKMKKFKSRLK